jgi:hypothetical protein
MPVGFALIFTGWGKLLGHRLLTIGAGMACVFFSLTTLVLKLYWFFAFMIFLMVGISLAVRWHEKKLTTPCCGNKVSKKQIYESSRLTNFIGIRPIILCQYCDTTFTYSKWPWRIICIGGNLALICLLLSFLEVDLGDTISTILKVLLWVGALLMFGGMLTTKFVPVTNET